jgi:membrane protease YdiL (CAAX protease family)
MQVPPVQFDLPTEKVDPPLTRMPWVWLLSILVFGFIIVSSLLIHDKESPLKSKTENSKEKMLEMQLSLRSMVPEPKSDRNARMFDAQIDELLVPSKKDAHAQKLRIVLRKEDRQVPFNDDIKNLAKSANSEDQAFAKLFSEPAPKKEEAMALLKQIDGNEVSEKLAAVQVKESFGDKEIRAKTFDPTQVYGIAVIGLGVMVGIGIGMVLWYVYLFQRQAGRLLPKGLPLANIDLAQAERLMFVALITISTYVLSSVVLAKLLPKSVPGIELLGYAPIFVVIAICLNVPIFGWKITAKSIGLSFEKFPEKVGWAFAAFFANMPILILFILLTAALSQYLPGGGHPASEALLKHPTPFEIAKIAFLACIIAPIWEEIFFRGILFPAFAKAFGKPIWGALLSSFIFASIHPQGFLGVPVLMGIALMLCAVSYQTKSLVSNMILHGLHNGATLTAALLLAPLFA